MFEFYFRSSPSKNTIQSLIDSVQVTRDEIKAEHGVQESYYAGQYDALNNLVQDLTNFKNTLPR